jgi:UDP-GlcNAc3NAcA epimerase
MSRRKRIVTIVGARPQYIKLAPLHRELAVLRLDHQIINTGQHYDRNMAGVFFSELRLPRPAANLGVGSGSAGEMTSRIIAGCAKALKKLAPDVVVVVGDTNSTLGGALAAVQLNLPVAHVEAGLRCFDLSVPEELNRVVTDRIASLWFCPTPESVANLKREGITRNVFLSGDLLYDVVASERPDRRAVDHFLREQELTREEYLLATVHRADSVDRRENLRAVVRLLKSTKETILFPLHPRTRRRLEEFGLFSILHKARHVKLVEPLNYRDSLAAICGSRMVLTDSGGLQREAYFLKVPTLLLRDVTEWVEINRSGGSKIVGVDRSKFVRGLSGSGFHFSNRSLCRIGAARRIARKIGDSL